MTAINVTTPWNVNVSSERTTAENQIRAVKIKINRLDGERLSDGLMSYEPFQEKDKPSINVADTAVTDNVKLLLGIVLKWYSHQDNNNHT